MDESEQPTVALSVKQPWAWLIIHGGKDIENRDWRRRYPGRILIHASKQMLGTGYERCMAFVQTHRPAISIIVPEPWELEYGGIIGEVQIVGCVESSASPWFTGPYGYVLANPKPLPFKACKGHLGFWEPAALRKF